MKLIQYAFVASLTLGAVACASSGETDSSDDNLENASIAPVARFAPHLAALRDALEKPATTEGAASKLLLSGRGAAFSLQALCRIYKDQDPKFVELRDDFKSLEDGIGAYDKWDSVYQEAVARKSDASTLAKLKAKRDEALATFTKLLTDKQWRTTGTQISRVKRAEDFLKAFHWKPRAQDRDLVLESISDELKAIKKTTYDMHILEEGNGVHELRRDIRWALMEQLNLNGMVVYKDKSVKCPIPAYEGLLTQPVASSKYVAFKPTAVEPSPCQVDKCVVLGAAQAVEDLGAIKDQAEKEVNISGSADVVPPALQAKAQAIYDSILKNNLVGVYRDELKACKSAKSDAGAPSSPDAGGKTP